MNDKRKRNIIIGALCGVLLIMAVGYAAFATQLNIEGTTSITSSWNVKITNIEEKNKVGTASSKEDPTHEDLTATFSVSLISPGDSIEYDITVENQGTIDAELARIKMSKSTNPAIKFSYSGIEEGSILAASTSDVLTVKVEYDSSVTSQPEDTSAEVTVTLDYVQKGHKSEWVPDDAVKVGGQNVIPKDNGSDGLYADPVEAGRYVYAGANPDNYITFNGEEAGWRIIGVESNGEIKIMRDSSVTNKAFDSKGLRTTGYCQWDDTGCTVWAAAENFADISNSNSGPVDKDSELKTWLNETYLKMITKNTEFIVMNHVWYFGWVHMEGDNISQTETEEKRYSTNSTIGLVSVSDYMKSNTNVDGCWPVLFSIGDGDKICPATTWMYQTSSYWLINAMGYSTCNPSSYLVSCFSTRGVANAHKRGVIFNSFPGWEGAGIVPAIYLKSEVQLSGTGTKQNPYRIIS